MLMEQYKIMYNAQLRFLLRIHLLYFQPKN